MLLARAVWWLALGARLALLVAALLLYHEQLRTLSIIPDSQVRTKIFASLTSLGLSGSFLADYSVAITLARALVYFAVAFLIYRGRSDDWMALFVSVALVVFTVGRLLDRLAGPLSFAFPAAVMTGVAFASFNILFYMFPDGRFVPRWTRKAGRFTRAGGPIRRWCMRRKAGKPVMVGSTCLSALQTRKSACWIWPGLAQVAPRLRRGCGCSKRSRSMWPGSSSSSEGSRASSQSELCNCGARLRHYLTRPSRPSPPVGDHVGARDMKGQP